LDSKRDRGAAVIQLIVLIVAAVFVVLLTGCAATVPIDCRLPEPPAGLLTIPEPLPPVPADLPKDK
jgi:hypothetical protein